MKKFITKDVMVREIDEIKPLIRNILAFMKEADQDDISEGMSWYPRGYEIVKHYSKMFNKKPMQIAGVISALSPGTNWAQNLVDAENLMRGLSHGDPLEEITTTTYSNKNRTKAGKIWHSNLTESQIFTLLLGVSQHVNKTSHFFMNLIYPQNNKYVTIDRHTFRIAINALEAPYIGITEKRYRHIAQAFKLAGKSIGFRGSEIQAITWVRFREQYVDRISLKPSIKLDRFVYSQILYNRKKSVYDETPF